MWHTPHLFIHREESSHYTIVLPWAKPFRPLILRCTNILDSYPIKIYLVYYLSNFKHGLSAHGSLSAKVYGYVTNLLLCVSPWLITPVFF